MTEKMNIVDYWLYLDEYAALLRELIGYLKAKQKKLTLKIRDMKLNENKHN